MHLREAVDVERGQPERASIASRSPSVHGSAPKTPARAETRRVGDVVGDRERVARRAAEDLGAEILEQLRLPRRVPPSGTTVQPSRSAP
jgi:hypothetical protein